DQYAAEFTARAFRDNGIFYEKAELPKSGLYLELLPRLCSSEVQLLDDETLVHQLSSLERRTVAGGKDKIDHPKTGHDDLANVVAGVCHLVATPRIVLGAL